MRQVQSLQRIFALNNADQKHDDRRDQQDVNEPPDGIDADYPKKPKDQEDECDRYKHIKGICVLLRVKENRRFAFGDVPKEAVFHSPFRHIRFLDARAASRAATWAAARRHFASCRLRLADVFPRGGFLFCCCHREQANKLLLITLL